MSLAAAPPPPPLSEQYAAGSWWELTLAPTGVVRGRVFTTDAASGTVVMLADPAADAGSTTAATAPTVHLVQARHVVQATPQQAPAPAPAWAELPALPAKLQRRVLEERERRAAKLAEERLRHINPEATPDGQECFDRLLKACHLVAWTDGGGILVQDLIRVDPPYTADACRLLLPTERRGREAPPPPGQASASLKRVQKIVAAKSAVAASDAASEGDGN